MNPSSVIMSDQCLHLSRTQLLSLIVKPEPQPSKANPSAFHSLTTYSVNKTDRGLLSPHQQSSKEGKLSVYNHN